MAITQDTQNITTTASELGTNVNSRRLLVVRNPTGSGATIYIGGAGVTSATGAFELAPGDDPMVFTTAEGDSLAGEAWFAIASSGTATGVIVTEG